MTVLVLLVATVATVLATSKRTKTVLRRTKGKIEVAQGCTVFSPGIFDDEDRLEKTANEISELQRDGPISMFDTPIGSIWYPVAAWTLPALVEKNESDQYHLRSMVRPGDIVLDVGANVGTETRSALGAGAEVVVAFEPEPVALECLRRNLSSEVREKRVVIVPKGAWDREDVLPLHLDPANGGGASFVQKRGQSISAPLTTVDHVVSELNLSKVNLIKIHAEGAEAKILSGAAETIRRYHPRLTVALEHRSDDASVLPTLARKIWPGYRLELTRCTKTSNLIHPEAALMRP